MVDSKRYDPTITRFQKHTKQFVSGKTKKGHVTTGERDTGDVVKEEGILVKVDSKNLTGNGWEVKIGNQTVKCTYGDNIMYLPDYTVNGSYYIPKKECKVEVSMDKKSKIYTITKINDPNKKPISMTNKQINIQGNGNASLTIEEDTTTITGDNLSVEGDIKIETSDEDKDLPKTISVTDMYKKIQDLEIQVKDNKIK